MSERKQWFIANGLAGVTLAAATGSFAVDPNIFTALITIGLLIVFYLISMRELPNRVGNHA